MASSNDNVSMALFCDFENVALGVRDANYEKFDIKPVLERLLLKGSIVVKKAYCDWDRYKGFKAPMHEANFELIEIPHVRQSGKNSADIRMVVDALDLCYTKAHVNTFVIISGDSDFSPLVSKLRENNKKVIGVGVKQSTSDLLVANCDEFIFYDDLVRESRRAAAKRDTREGQPAVKRTPEEEKGRREEMDKRRREAVDMAVETFDALVSERGDSGKIWASVLKEAIKRRKPDFSESYYGFRTFGNLLEEAKARGLLEFGRDEKSGAYVYRSSGAPGEQGSGDGSGNPSAPVQQEGSEGGRHEGRRGRGRGRNRGGDRHAAGEPVSEEVSAELELAQDENAYAEAEAVHAAEDANFAQQPRVDADEDAEQGEQDEQDEQEAVALTSSEQDDLDEEERALDAAAAAIANSAGGNQRQLGRDGQPKRSSAKMPARQAKAKQKAAQATTSDDVWAKGKGRGKPAQAGGQRGKQGQQRQQGEQSVAQAAQSGGQPRGQQSRHAVQGAGQAAVQPVSHEAVQPAAQPVSHETAQPAIQPAAQPAARPGRSGSRQAAAQQVAEAVAAPVADSAEAGSAAKPAAKGRARAPAKSRAKAGESRITAAAAEAAAATEAPVVAEAAAEKPAKPGRAAAARARAAKPVADVSDADVSEQPARKPAARRPRKAA